MKVKQVKLSWISVKHWLKPAINKLASKQVTRTSSLVQVNPKCKRVGSLQHTKSIVSPSDRQIVWQRRLLRNNPNPARKEWCRIADHQVAI